MPEANKAYYIAQYVTSERGHRFLNAFVCYARRGIRIDIKNKENGFQPFIIMLMIIKDKELGARKIMQT